MTTRYIGKTRSESLTIFKKLNTTSSSDLILMCRLLEINIVNKRIYMRDELTSPLRDGNYILNLDGHDGTGTHWTAFIKQNKNVFYFDSFGMLPAQDQIDLFKKQDLDLYYSTQSNQDLLADSCGFWIIYFLYHMTRQKRGERKSLGAKFIEFNKMFSAKDQKSNEKKLRDLINKII